MKRILITSFLLSAYTFLYAQNPLVKKWDARFGGTELDFVTCFLQTNDGGYILGGFSASPLSGDKSGGTKGNYDFWVVKIDALGAMQWDKDLGATYDERLLAIQQTKDGGYLLGGSSSSGIDGDKTEPNIDTVNFTHDYWIVKLDSLGNKLWDRDFGGIENENLSTVKQCTDGGFILGGSSNSIISGHKTQANRDTINFTYDYWIVKTDSNGIKQWDKTFGGNDDDQLTSINLSNDGGYVLSGPSVSGMNGDKSQVSVGNYDYWVVKIDSLGIKQWDKTFGGTELDLLYSAQATYDGGYIFGGTSKSGIGGDKSQPNWDNTNITGDYWVVKIDSMGNKQWDKDYGGIKDEYSFGNIWQTIDSGFLLSGISYSDISGNKTENNLGVEQSWIVKTNASGIIEWDKTLLTAAEDECGYAIQTKDGCFVMTNSCPAGIGGYKSQDFRGLEDYWIVKFCDSTKFATALPSIGFDEHLIIYPNPFTSEITISFNKQNTQYIACSIFDVLGNTVFQSRDEKLSMPYSKAIDLSFLVKGTYYVVVTIDGEKRISRIIKE